MYSPPANTGLPAVAIAPAAATANSSAADFPVPAPTLSQPAFDRWTDLPVDVVVQVMYWTMLGAGSARHAAPLALTSTCFAQAGQDFRTGPWYQDAQSVVMHERIVGWISTYLTGFGHPGSVRSPNDASELESTLRSLGSTGVHLNDVLDIESKLKPVLNQRQLDGFRRYPGPSLALLTGVSEASGDQIVEIARALPADVCLRVQFIARTFLQFTLEDMVAGVIRCVALNGRATAFDLKWAIDLTTAPDVLGKVLDIACGPGRVAFFGFGSLEDPHAMLQALGDRCSRFRQLKLVMFNCSEPPAREALLALAAALEQRQLAGLSRLTVVIGCDELRPRSEQANRVFSADEQDRFEAAGLYFALLDNEPATHPTMQKVLRSLRAGPIDPWLEPSRTTGD